MKERSALDKHRSRMARAGFVRMEISVRKEDVLLMRRLAAALTDPLRQARVRTFLRRAFLVPAAVSLKELLANAPLEGIELTRSRDLGRKVDL